MTDAVKSPLIGIYILDISGIPLFARHYEGTLSEHEAVLVGGFFSAIEIFTRSSLKSELVDIGIKGRRFFFNNVFGKYIQIILVKTTEEDNIDESLRNLIKLIHYRIQLAIEITTEISEENNLDANQVIKGIGSSIDSLVFESTLEDLDDDGSIEHEIKSGQSIVYTKKDYMDVLDKIKDLLN